MRDCKTWPLTFEMLPGKVISVYAENLVLKLGVAVIRTDTANNVSGNCRACAVAVMLYWSVVGGAYSLAGQAEDTPWSEIPTPISDLLRAGHLNEAVENARQGVKRVQAKYGNEHPKAAIAMSQLGQVYQSLNRFDEARAQYEQALKIRKASYGTIHPSVAASLLDIADVYREAGQYVRAGSAYDRALAAMEKARGKAHQDVSVVLHNFAMLRNFQLNGAEAEALIKRAIAIRESSQEQDPYSVVGSLALLGKIYEQEGKYSDARTSYDRAFRVMANAKLDQDYTAGMLSFAIANLEKRRRNNQEAERFYRMSIKTLEDASGQESPALGPVLQGYADTLRSLNRLEEAKQVEARANTVLKQYYENSPAAPPSSAH